MKSIIRWAINNSPAINTLMVTVLVVGAVCLSSMRRETFPEFDLGLILVSIPYPAATPTEIEEGICQKIEEAVHPVVGIKKVTSVAQEGIAYLVIELQASVRDEQRVLNEIRSKIDRIPSFPELAEDPEVLHITFRQPAIRVAVVGPDDSSPEAEIALRSLAESVREDLLLLPTVSQANLVGARNYQIDIEMSEETLRKHALTLRRVADIVRRQNMELPGGTMKTEGEEILLRAKSKSLIGEEIQRIPLVTQPNGAVLTVGDLGVVRDEFDDNSSRSRLNGKPAQVISIERASEEDLLTIVEEVKASVANYDLPPGYSLETFHDQSVDVKERLHMLTNDGLQGLFLVFLVLAIFLELRLAFWVAMGMPVAILGTAIYLLYEGHTLNMLTMFGFMMVLGIVVDDAIVIADNIHTHRQRGASLIDAAINGTVEVFPSIVASAATAIIAFVPMMFVSGIMGKFVAVLPVAVVATLVISVIETSLTLPCHMAHEENLFLSILAKVLTPLHWIHTLLQRTNALMDKSLDQFADRMYMPLVSRLLRYPAVAISSAIVVLMVTTAFIPAGITPWVLMPKLDSSAIVAKVAFPDGTPLSVTDEATRRLELAVQRLGEKHAVAGQSLVKLTHRHIGAVTGISSGGPEARTNGSHVGYVEAELLPASQRSMKSDVFLAEWRKVAGEFPGVELLSFGTPHFGPGGAPVEFKLLSTPNHMRDLEQAVEECKAKLGEFSGVFDITDDSRPGKWEFQLQVKDEAHAMGVTAADLAETVRASYYGEEVMRLQRGRHEVKLMVRYPREQRQSLSDFEEIRIRTIDGSERPITELAAINVERGYAELNRLDNLRCVTITADVDENQTNASEVVAALQASFVPALLGKYPGVRVRWEGQQAQSVESVRSLMFGYIFALLAMYVVLTLEFRSYFQPFLVMMIIPFGFVGAIWGHALLGMPISLFSVFGLVALTGVMVNDSIVIVDFINHRVREGTPLLEAVVDAGRLRLRPVLLNSVTTVIGLAPLLLDRSFQAQGIIPMAVSMAFGQMLSTTIVLLLMPTFYYAISRFANAFSRAAHHSIDEPAGKFVVSSS